MITQATISIIGVLLVLMMAWGFYAVPARKTKGRALYALMILFAIVHLVGDGFLRALADDPLKLSLRSLNTAGVFCYMTYLAGMILVLQIAFDIVWVKTRVKVKAFPCIVLQIPSIGLIVAAYIVKGAFLSALLKYMPLLYALILFFEIIWYFEKLDKGLRIGIIASMTGCILMFVANSVFEIATIPLMIPVLLVVTAYSWSGRGELIITDVTEEELERLQDKGYIGATSEDEEVSEDGVKTKTVIYTDRPEAETEDDSELEQMMKKTSKRNVERLSLEDEIEEIDQVEPAQPETVQPESEITESVESVSSHSEVLQPQRPSPERLVIPEDTVSQATGMQAVEPSPMEQLTAAAVLTAESDRKTESAVQMIQNADENIADAIHYRPLILEKDLNDYYHRMKVAVTGKDYDTCLEIMSEMSDYRISGIHVTRYERIRHAVVDEQWTEVEKELADF